MENNNSFKNPNNNKPKKQFNFYWIYVILTVIFLGSLFFNGSKKAEEIDKGKLITLLKDRDIEKIDLINGEVAEIYLNDSGMSKYFPNEQGGFNTMPNYTLRIGSMERFEQDIEDAQEGFENPIYPHVVKRHNWGSEIISWILPIVIIFGFWFLIIRMMGRNGGAGGGGNVFNIGKSQAKLYDNESDVKVTFKDVAGLEEAKEEVMEVYGIRIGDPVVPDVTFEYNEEQGLCYGKAFDNRLGCVCIIETMKELLKDSDLAVDVVGAFAAQEEVGTRGAAVTSQVVKPDFAIVFEGSPADDFYYSVGMAQGCLRKGVQIRHRDLSYISNPVFIDLAHKIGDKYGIKYQDTVRRGGSTNAGKISLEGKAVPVLVLGVPSRYVHTHSNFAAMEDIDAAVRMAAEVIRSLDEEMMNKILRKDILS